jgi:hypothetical protein
MEFKLTELAERLMEAKENDEECDDCMGSSNGFWYDMTKGGYFKPKKVLSDPEQLRQVTEALKLLREFEEDVYDRIVPEF